jgi:hypothetical protein
MMGHARGSMLLGRVVGVYYTFDPSLPFDPTVELTEVHGPGRQYFRCEHRDVLRYIQELLYEDIIYNSSIHRKDAGYIMFIMVL